MMFDAAARSVVKVFVATSWLPAAGVPVPLAGALLGEGDTAGLDEAGAPAAALFAGVGVLLALAGAIEPAGLEEEGGGAEDGAALVEFVPDIGTVAPFGLPITQPGTRSLEVALAGPSVTAMQPGKFGNKLPGSTFS
jgi:hypothetical protein